ncbi:unnamed protein product [Brassicogethes aeneus]|uniref:Uncharacterized protein n=1 Tax=Brassicogethes aeneus TaxID=1431903 RepID=A0A9P0FA18_BRAAE|nr:unnamed protein product [Brassicogethes aeneus]
MYFSDGSASQYKNRYNLLNLLHHEEDFQITAEWHYYATHGKAPSDGLGGTLKRLADRANLQSKSGEKIQNPDELFIKQCLSGQTKCPVNHFVSISRFSVLRRNLTEGLKMLYQYKESEVVMPPFLFRVM